MWTCMQLAPKISYSFHNHILKANFVSSDFARCSQEVMGDGWCHGGYVHLCYTVYTPNLQFQPSLELAEVSASLWALNKILVGFVVSALHKVTLKPNAVLPRIKQYHLPEEAIKGIKPVINFLLEKGVLVPTSYPCNTPILPIPKASRPGEWRFMQDLKAVNSTDAAKPIVPDINSILASLPSNSNFQLFSEYHCTLKAKTFFAFTFEGQQYTFTRAPQGFLESLSIYAAGVKRDLDDLVLSGVST